MAPYGASKTSFHLHHTHALSLHICRPEHATASSHSPGKPFTDTLSNAANPGRCHTSVCKVHLQKHLPHRWHEPISAFPANAMMHAWLATHCTQDQPGSILAANGFLGAALAAYPHQDAHAHTCTHACITKLAACLAGTDCVYLTIVEEVCRV